MEIEEREIILSKVVSGVVIYETPAGETYFIHPPSKLTKHRAQKLYEDLLYELSFERILSREESVLLAKREGIWSDDDEKMLAAIPKALDDLKLALYKAALDIGDQKNIRAALDHTHRSHERLIKDKHAFDYITREYQATTAKVIYSIAMSTTDIDGNPILQHEDFWRAPHSLLSNLVFASDQNTVSLSQIRELARTDPWRSSWSIGKAQALGRDISELTNEQRTLCIYSDMYDSVYKHSERPSDSIIEDDDMLDGWLISQSREIEKDRTTRDVEQALGPKTSRHDEILLPAADREQAKKIDDLNSFHGKMVKKNRTNLLKARGKVEEQNMPDSQQEMQRMSNEGFKRTGRRR